MRSLTSHKLMRCFQKAEVNFGSRSEIIESGSSCNLNISPKNALAVSTAVSVSSHARTCTRREKRSTMVVMALKLFFVVDKCVIDKVHAYRSPKPSWKCYWLRISEWL